MLNESDRSNEAAETRIKENRTIFILYQSRERQKQAKNSFVRWSSFSSVFFERARLKKISGRERQKRKS